MAQSSNNLIEHFDSLPINLIAQRLLKLSDIGIQFPIEQQFLIDMTAQTSTVQLYNNTYDPADINLFRYHNTLLSQIFCPVVHFIDQPIKSVVVGVQSDDCLEVKHTGLEYFDVNLILDPTLLVERFVTNHAAVLIIDHDFHTIKFIDPHVGKTHPHNIHTIKHICRELIGAGYVYTDTTTMSPSFQSLYDVHNYVGMGCVSWAMMLGLYTAINRGSTLHELFEPFYSNECSMVLHLFVYWYKQTIIKYTDGAPVRFKLDEKFTAEFTECQELCSMVLTISSSTTFDKIPNAGKFLHDMCHHLSIMLTTTQQKISFLGATWSELTIVWAVTHQLNLIMLLWKNDFNSGELMLAYSGVNSDESKIIYLLFAMYKLFDGEYHQFVPVIPKNIIRLFVQYYVEPYTSNYKMDDIVSMDNHIFTQYIHKFTKLVTANASVD